MAPALGKSKLNCNGHGGSLGHVTTSHPHSLGNKLPASHLAHNRYGGRKLSGQVSPTYTIKLHRCSYYHAWAVVGLNTVRRTPVTVGNTGSRLGGTPTSHTTTKVVIRVLGITIKEVCPHKLKVHVAHARPQLGNVSACPAVPNGNGVGGVGNCGWWGQ